MTPRRRGFHEPFPIDALRSEDIPAGEIAHGDELEHDRAAGGCQQRDGTEPVCLQRQQENQGSEGVLVEEDGFSGRLALLGDGVGDEFQRGGFLGCGACGVG